MIRCNYFTNGNNFICIRPPCPGSELQVLAAASSPLPSPPSLSPSPMKSISKKSIALPFPPSQRDEPVVRRWAECCCHSFNLRPFCDPISAWEQSSLQQDVAPARASSPSDGETDGFPVSSRLVCLFVSFPICPFHRVVVVVAAAAAAAIRLCFIHDRLWRLRSSLCDRGWIIQCMLTRQKLCIHHSCQAGGR